ncbi:MAG: hypothetical protein OXT67_14085 [Zetaproteobacteria bacterium]|nr:hypothetical protein [Zetaproteobacteria bacterium]
MTRSYTRRRATPALLALLSMLVVPPLHSQLREQTFRPQELQQRYPKQRFGQASYRLSSYTLPQRGHPVRLLSPFQKLRSTGHPVTLANLVSTLKPQLVLNGGQARSLEYPIPAGGLVIDQQTVSDFTPQDKLWPSYLCLDADRVEIRQVGQGNPQKCRDALQTGVFLSESKKTSKPEVEQAYSAVCTGEKTWVLFQSSPMSHQLLHQLIATHQPPCRQTVLLGSGGQSGLYFKSPGQGKGIFRGAQKMILPSALVIPK